MEALASWHLQDTGSAIGGSRETLFLQIVSWQIVNWQIVNWQVSV